MSGTLLGRYRVALQRPSGAVLISALLLCVPTVALAAAPGAKTGTLMAAAFETFGYQAQSQVLASLATMLDGLAALIFLCAIISAIITASFLGRYRATIWLLVGPPVYFFLVLNTKSVAGVEWEFGTFKDVDGELKKTVRAADYPDSNTRVSWFFHQYNLLISDVVQQGVALLTSYDLRPQMMFMARQAVMDHIFGTQPDNADYTALLAFFHAHCVNEIGDATLIALAKREDDKLKARAPGAETPSGFKGTPDYRAAVQRYCQSFPLRNKPFPPGPWWTYVVSMGVLPCTNADGTFTLKDAQAGKRITCQVSCFDMWKWVVPAAVIENRRIVDYAVDKNVEPYAQKLTRNLIDDILGDVRKGISIAEGNSSGAEPCPMPGGANSVKGVPRGGPEADNLAKVLIPMQIRRGLTGDPRGALIDQVIAHSGITLQRWNTKPEDNPARKDDVANRYKAVELAHSQKYEAFWLMNTLPQIQGVILYVLAATYPFFALTVIIPGQAGAFLGWCALWAWAKSWDIGWALVMVADEMLWALLPHSAYYNFDGGTVNEGSTFDTPVNVLEAAFGGDTSYTLGNYWVLLSLMISAVPLLTAQAIMGSKKAMMGILVDGLRNFGSRLGGSAADWEAHRNVERLDVLNNQVAISRFKGEADRWLAEQRALVADAERQFSTRSAAWDAAKKEYERGKQVVLTAQDLTALEGADPDGVVGKVLLAAGWTKDKVHQGAYAADQARVGAWNASGEFAEGVSQSVMDTRLGRFWQRNTGLGPLQVPRAAPVVDRPNIQDWAAIQRQHLPEIKKQLQANLDKRLEVAGKAWNEAHDAWKKTWNALLKDVSKLATLAYNFSPGLGGGLLIARVANPVGPDGRANRPAIGRLINKLADDDMMISKMLIDNIGFPEVHKRHNSRDVDENKALLAEMERQRYVAEWYDIGSNTSFVAGLGVAYVGKGRGVSAYAAAGLFNFSYQLQANATGIRRSINSFERERIETNAEVWFADAMRSPYRLMVDEYRAAISNRGEWWNVPELPIGARARSEDSAGRLRTEIDGIHGRISGEAVWDAVGAGSKGRALGALH